MLHFHSLEGLELNRTWAAIGMFDGVHRGHQAILSPLAQEAHAAGSPAAVVTFFPHPSVILRGIEDPLYLTTPEERADLLGGLGIDAVITLNFDQRLASMGAEAFMKNMCAGLGLQQLWVGSDFALGRNRQGDIPALRRMGETLGYSIRVIPEVTLDSSRISSSQIRKLIQEGQVTQAAQALGRPYQIEGRVVQGDERGRKLGFPTANLDYWPKKMRPANGVYATWAWIGGSFSNSRRVPAVTNIGVRPTFQGIEHRIEAHLLDFNRDLYGQPLKLEFLKFLRPEQRFASIEALQAQIEADKQHAKEVFFDEP
jgi:riboflavin kinase / FMN adenylyltransferase